LVVGKHVRVEKDISGAGFFDRLLRYVYLVADEVDEDDELASDAMVRSGHAKTLSVAPDNRYRDLLATAQDEDRQAGLCLWGACEQVDDKSEMQSDSPPTDPNCLIKGNISDKSYDRNYFSI
jgi:endonuclease YncB( thermonuclease family)